MYNNTGCVLKCWKIGKFKILLAAFFTVVLENKKNLVLWKTMAYLFTFAGYLKVFKSVKYLKTDHPPIQGEFQ